MESVVFIYLYSSALTEAQITSFFFPSIFLLFLNTQPRRYHPGWKRKRGVDWVPPQPPPMIQPCRGRMIAIVVMVVRMVMTMTVTKNHVIFGSIPRSFPVVVVYGPCVMIVVLQPYRTNSKRPYPYTPPRCTCRNKTERRLPHRGPWSPEIIITLMTLMI